MVYGPYRVYGLGFRKSGADYGDSIRRIILYWVCTGAQFIVAQISRSFGKHELENMYPVDICILPLHLIDVVSWRILPAAAVSALKEAPTD